MKREMIKVFFDGKCGLCSKEINHYRDIAKGEDFLWEDVASDPSPLTKLRVTQQDALRRLHAQDSEVRTSGRCISFIKQHLPHFKRVALARFVKLPLIFQISEFLYNRFADYRFARRLHCKILTQTDIRNFCTSQPDNCLEPPSIALPKK